MQSSLKYSLNGAPPAVVPFSKGAVGTVNIADDDKPDLRFIGWIEAGKVDLRVGANTLVFTMDSANNHHGAIDCFVFTDERFVPSGTNKPE